MTPDQCRAARAFLRLTQPQLASLAGVSAATVRKFECFEATPIRANLRAIRKALEDEGAVWIAGDMPGVQFRPREEALH